MPGKHSAISLLAASAVVLLSPCISAQEVERVVQEQPLRVLPRALPEAPRRLVVARPELFQTIDSARIDKRFKLGQRPRHRMATRVEIEAAGQLEVKAHWRGDAELTLSLHGPGQIDRKVTGPSPLRLAFEIAPQQLEQGSVWAFAIGNYGPGTARGVLEIQHPLKKTLDYQLVTPGRLLGYLAPEAGEPPESDEPIKRILADGTVEIEYPDGSKFQPSPVCGFTRISPDGTESKALCSSVQNASLPELPSDALGDWVRGIADTLQMNIQGQLTPEDFENYLKSEVGKDIYGIVEWRVRFLEIWLSNS